MYRVLLLVSLLAELAPGISGYVTAPPLYNLPSTTQAFGSMQGTTEMGLESGVTASNLGMTPEYEGTSPSGPVASENDPLGLGIVGYEAVPFEGTYGEAGYRISVPGMPSFAIAIPTSTGYQVIETAEVTTTPTPVPEEISTTSSYPGSDLFGFPSGPEAAVTTGGVSGGNVLPSEGFSSNGFSGVVAPSGGIVSNGAVGRPEPPMGAVETSYPSSRSDPLASSGVAPNPPMSMLSGNAGSSLGLFTVSKPDPPSNVRAPPSPPSSMLPNNMQPNSGGQSLWDQINTSVMDMKSVLPLALMSDNIDPINLESPSFNNMEGLPSGSLAMNPLAQMGLSMPSFNTGMMAGQGLSGSMMQKMMASMQMPMKTASSQSFPQLPKGPSPYQNLFSGLIGTEAPATVDSFSQSGSTNPQMPNYNQAKTLMSAMMRSAIVTANLPKPTPTLPTSQSFRLSPLSSSSTMGSAYAKLMAQMTPTGSFPMGGASQLMGDYSSGFPSPSSQMEMASENGYSAYAVPQMNSPPQPTRTNGLSSPSQAMKFLYSQSRKIESLKTPSISRNRMSKVPNYSVIPKPTKKMSFPTARNTANAAKAALAAAQSSIMAGRAKSLAQTMARSAAAASRTMLQNAQKKLTAPSRRPYSPTWKKPAARAGRKPSPPVNPATKKLSDAIKLKRLAMLKKLPYSVQAKKRPLNFQKKRFPSKRPRSRGISPMEMMILTGGMGEMELAL